MEVETYLFVCGGHQVDKGTTVGRDADVSGHAVDNNENRMEDRKRLRKWGACHVARRAPFASIL
jgi:hypothetical protein